MKNLRLILRLVLVAVACSLIAACADNPTRQTDLDYRSQRSPTVQGANSSPGSSGQHLTIQSGEGEKLNLPWLIRDAQGWINGN